MVGRYRLDRAFIEFNIYSRQRVVEPTASGETCKARARERKGRTVTAKQTSGLCPYRKSINYDNIHQSSALSILSRFLNLSSVAALKTTLLYGKIKVTGDLINTFRANYVSPYFTWEKDTWAPNNNNNLVKYGAMSHRYDFTVTKSLSYSVGGISGPTFNSLLGSVLVSFRAI